MLLTHGADEAAARAHSQADAAGAQLASTAEAARAKAERVANDLDGLRSEADALWAAVRRQENATRLVSEGRADATGGLAAIIDS